MRILFQGDSITDVGRRKDGHDEMVGWGYPFLVKAELDYEEPNCHTIYNRGINGNRVVDLYARMKEDIINLKPDLMSILIGVNDAWHEFEEARGVDVEKYFAMYSMLVEEVKEALPNIKIMILEPFTLKGTVNEAYFGDFLVEVKKRAEKAKKIAEKYNLTFVPLQNVFDEAVTKAPENYWLLDGVHPSTAGHELIKREWLKAMKNLQTTRQLLDRKLPLSWLDK